MVAGSIICVCIYNNSDKEVTCMAGKDCMSVPDDDIMVNGQISNP